MPIDAKHEDLQSLRIDRTERGSSAGEPPTWARRYIVIGIVIIAVLSLCALAYRMFAADVPEVQVTRAAAESSDVGGTVLSATGYIVAHHTINVNSKVTGRLAWCGKRRSGKRGTSTGSLGRRRVSRFLRAGQGRVGKCSRLFRRTSARIASRRNSASSTQS